MDQIRMPPKKLDSPTDAGGGRSNECNRSGETAEDRMQNAENRLLNRRIVSQSFHSQSPVTCKGVVKERRASR